MIQEEYVSIEQAQALKEVNFPQSERKDGLFSYPYYTDENNFKYIIPTQALVQKWLREVKNIHICPRLVMKSQSSMGYLVSPMDITKVINGTPYGIESTKFNDNTFRYMEVQDTYEEALRIAIDKVITFLLKNE